MVSDLPLDLGLWVNSLHTAPPAENSHLGHLSICVGLTGEGEDPGPPQSWPFRLGTQRRAGLGTCPAQGEQAWSSH